MVEGSEHGCAVDRHPLPLFDGGGQLQLAFRVPLRVPGGRGEDRVPPEGVHLRPRRDRVQNSPQTAAPSLGRGRLLRRRHPG